MADGTSDGEPVDDGSQAALGSAPRIGRQIATLVFWCCALYMAAVGFYSIPIQMFRPEAGQVPPAVTCAAGLESLRSEMLGRASEYMAAGGIIDAPGLQRWLMDWDRRHAALEGRCHGEGERPYVAISRFRHRLETNLRRLDREQAPLLRELDEGLRSLTAD